MDYFEYITSGVSLNTSISVDFTGSNGDVDNPRSLHYYNKYN